MNNRTITVTLSAEKEEVFAYLCDLAHWPDWATEFCRELRREGPHWKMHTPLGEVYVTLTACADTGVIDFFWGDRPDEMAVLPLRVIRLPRGCAVTCTLFQPVDLPDDIFAWRHGGLLRELRGLAARFAGGSLQAVPGEGAPFFPGIVTAKFYETWDFYTTHLGFRTVDEGEGHVHLRHPGGAQLAVMRHEQPGQPAPLVSGTEGRGFWFGLDVADADSEHARLVAEGIEAVVAPRDTLRQGRQFVVLDPNGVLIQIADRPAPAALAEASYAGVG